MKRYLLVFIFLGLLNSLHGQTIEGVVYDADTKKEIPGVVVYLNGTSIHTVSNNDGYFCLTAGSKINTALVISHLSYESIAIDNPFEHNEKVFFLKEKVNTLAQVVVVPDQFSRDEKMKVFKEQFLGEGRGGRSCVILNEEDIVLNFDRQTNRLIGSSKNRIMIENKYLAYTIIFDLHSFSIQYSQNSMDNRYMERFSIMGTYALIDKNPNNHVIRNRRDEIYHHSRQYFWKNFIANTLKEAKFKIYNHNKQIEIDQYFTVANTPPHTLVQIRSGTNLSRISSRLTNADIFGVISISNNNRYTSEAIFLTDHFSIDQFGNISAPGNVIFAGDMAQQRIGDVLPLDFSGTP